MFSTELSEEFDTENCFGWSKKLNNIII